MISQPIIIDKATQQTTPNTGRPYTLYEAAGQNYSAFEECKGKAETGDTVIFEYEERNGYKNIKRFIEVKKPESKAPEGSLLRHCMTAAATALSSDGPTHPSPKELMDYAVALREEYMSRRQ